MAKILIEKTSEMFGEYSNFTRDQLVALIDERISILAPEIDRASVFFSVSKHSLPYDDDPSISFTIKWKQLETDFEEAAREKREAANKVHRLQAERAAYERLKAQFEPSTDCQEGGVHDRK